MRLQMLQVARLAPNLLGPSAESVGAFVRSQLHPDGGFMNREARPDLYYTVFGLDCLVALQQPTPADQVRPYLESFGRGADLDLLHLTCLARCWSAIGGAIDPALADAVEARLQQHRAADGGYHVEPDAEQGSAYGCFVATGAMQDLGRPTPEPQDIGRCLDGLRTADGGYTNEPDIPLANVPATAAAITLQHQLELPIAAEAGDFLLGCAHTEGGFFAMDGAPMPDLLSTAVALHALSAMNRPIGAFRDACLDFVDTLWTSRGSFYGNWAEEPEALDVEYTWYGLLALGHLSL